MLRMKRFWHLMQQPGQNAIQQAKEFSAVTPITGIALTKLDGSAKGGIVLSIVQKS